MAYTGIQPIIVSYLNNKTIKSNFFLLPIIIGILFPDIDVIFALLGTLFYDHNISLYLFTNKATHSFIMIILFYLFGLIIKEITKKQKPIIITQGIMIGITIHIIFDVIFSNQNIYILWPLNISFNIFKNIFLLDNYTKFLQVFDFLFFRFYGWYLIKQLISKPTDNIIYTKIITTWIKIELYFFIFMLIISLLTSNYFLIIWMILFSLSISFALFFTYLIRNQFIVKK